jgi:transglutaminase-like putative cysteine protease
MSSRRVFGVVLAGVLLGWAETDGIQWAVEHRALAAEARAVTSRHVERRSRVLAVSDAVRVRISPDGEEGRPPVLRTTAWQTWVSGRGSCGDGARVMVGMLTSLGIPAERVYLRRGSGPYVHVAVAYFDRGQWRLVDTLNSEPGFRHFAVERAQPLEHLVRANPFFDSYSYLNWQRLVFMPLDQTRPVPQPVVWLMENPPLLLALGKMALAALMVLLVV